MLMLYNTKCCNGVCVIMIIYLYLTILRVDKMYTRLKRAIIQLCVKQYIYWLLISNDQYLYGYIFIRCYAAFNYIINHNSTNCISRLRVLFICILETTCIFRYRVWTLYVNIEYTYKYKMHSLSAALLCTVWNLHWKTFKKF